MAITDLKKIDRTINNAIDYIINPKKTFNEKVYLISSYECTEFDTEKEFLFVQNLAKDIKGDYTKVGGKNILAWHVYQSFSPNDNVTPELAHSIGKELADNFLENKYQYVLATHLDKEHLHNHIIFNATSFTNYKKFRTEKNKQYLRLRKISNDICKKYNLSTIEYSNKKDKKLEQEYSNSFKFIEEKPNITNKDKSFKQILEDDLLDTLPQSINFNDFIQRMKTLGYEVIDDKFGLKFRQESQKYFTRLNSLGTEFSKEEIQKYLKSKRELKPKLQKTNLKNNTTQAKSILDLIDPKEILKSKISWRAKLKYCIDYYVFKSNNFGEFLKGMQDTGYTVKYGKHISFRCSGMDKNIRAKILGDDYTEERIKERILEENKLLPRVPNIKENTKIPREKVSIKKLIDITNNEKYNNEIYYQKFVRRYNTDIMIETDNFMRKYKYTEDSLKEAIKDLEKEVFLDMKELAILKEDFEKLAKIKITDKNKNEVKKAYDNLKRIEEKAKTRLNLNKKTLAEHKVVKDNLELFNKNDKTIKTTM